VKNSLRILHVPHAYHPVIGGAELLCKRVSEVMAAQGHEVRILTTDVGAVQAYYEFGHGRVASSNETISGVEVTRLPFSGRAYRAGGWVQANMRPRRVARRIAGETREYLHRRLTRDIADEIRHTRPDVVMTMPHLVTNVEAVLAAHSGARFPLVMVPFVHEQDARWNISQMAKALSAADAVIAQTDHEADRLAESYGVSRQRIFMTSEGVDLGPPAPSAAAAERKRVLFLGRQVRSKGISDLIDAMRHVWPKYPDAELAIAGIRVPESAEVDSQIAALPAEDRDRVVQHGTVSEAKKRQLLWSARCLVLPSKIESLGLVILDAWAHGRPVVTWDLPVFRSTVEHGVTGLMADPAQGPPAFAEAILRVLANPDEASRMGENGYAVARDKYSWNAVAAAYLDAYRYAIRASGDRTRSPDHQ
jgi:glycosyltransferase involved in cell wall biosynthesis